MINSNSHREVNIKLTNEDKQKLVSAFAWLIQEDKKQNPQFYKAKKI